jgi:hypothetical protein
MQNLGLAAGRDAAGRRALAVIRHMLAIWPSVQPPPSAAQWQARSSHYKNAFAARLLIKHPIGILGLLKLPAVGEQVVDRNFSIGNEACTFGLPDL